MSIVTRTGDFGTTALMYNRRVAKCDDRVEAYGAIDELNAALGLARSTANNPAVKDCLGAVQRDLVTVMGELATAPEDLERYTRDGFPRVTADLTAKLDLAVGNLESRNLKFSGWAVPGACLHAAALDLARTVCRRAERRVCHLHRSAQNGNPEIIVFLNRLSDLLWLLARESEVPDL
jgi:cob(I)alamin adenosyltransferase